MFIVKLTNRETKAVEYRKGEPGQGGVTHTPADAQKFDTRHEAENYIGRLVTWSGFYGNDVVSIEELPDTPVMVNLEVSRETAQYLRNLLGNLVYDEHMDELRRELYRAARVEFQPSQFKCEKWGITWKGAGNASD